MHKKVSNAVDHQGYRWQITDIRQSLPFPLDMQGCGACHHFHFDRLSQHAVCSSKSIQNEHFKDLEVGN